MSFPGAEGVVDPDFGVDPDVSFCFPGNVPHGEPLGEVPGVVELFGVTVEGCVGVAGVGVAGEVAPGTVPAGGVAVLPGGVAGDACGVAGCPCGVAVPPGGIAGAVWVEVWPGVLAPAAGRCAAAHVAQPSITDKMANFLVNICNPPAIGCSIGSTESLRLRVGDSFLDNPVDSRSMLIPYGFRYPADALAGGKAFPNKSLSQPALLREPETQVAAPICERMAPRA